MTTIYIAEEFCEISMSKGALFIEYRCYKKVCDHFDQMVSEERIKM